MRTLKAFLRYYKPYQAVFWIDLACAMLVSVIDLVFPQLLNYLTRSVFTQSAGEVLRILPPLAFGLLLMYLVRFGGRKTALGRRQSAESLFRRLVVEGLRLPLFGGDDRLLGSHLFLVLHFCLLYRRTARGGNKKDLRRFRQKSCNPFGLPEPEDCASRC